MKNFSTNIIILIIIIVSWVKAGLAGDWILNIINLLIFGLLIIAVAQNFNYKIFLKSFFPVIILVIIATASFFNPEYRNLEEKEWEALNIEDVLSKELNVNKTEFTLKSFNNIYKSSINDKELSINLSLDFEKKYNEKFKFEGSSCDILLANYSNQIKYKNIEYLPSTVISHKKLYIEFIYFIFQLSFGIIAYLSLKRLKDIRKILFFTVINGGLLSIAGIVQALTYIPSDNLKEIWGIWDTPEPRYFFASFTYKNHWCSFALLVMSFIICLIYKSKDDTSLVKKIILFLFLFSLIISIPLSGSRSGTLLLIIFILIISFIILKNKIFKIKFNIYFVTFFISIFLISKMINNKTDEMIINTKNQINLLLDGKYPFRIMLWKDIIKQISDKPLFGHGFNSYKAVNPKYQSSEVYDERNIVTKNAHHHFNPIVGYAHNDWLEKISEFGILGTFPFIFYFVIIIRTFIKTRSSTSKILLVGSIIFLIYAFVDFPSRTPCSFLLFSLSVGLALRYDSIVNEIYSK